MKLSSVYVLSLLFTMPGLVRHAYSQDYEARLLLEIQKAYEEFNYPEAEIKANTALSEEHKFTASQLTEIYKILGLIAFTQNRRDEATNHFKTALTLSPDLQLDRMMVSPKILKFVDAIRAQVQTSKISTATDIERSSIRYVLVKDKRSGAAFRSMLFPGWGQLYKAEKKKGIFLMTLWTAGAVATIATHIARSNAEDRYLAETDPLKISARFNTFNRLHKLRNSLALFSAAVWITSYLDALLTQPKAKTARSASTIDLYPSTSQGITSLNLEVKF